MPLCWNCLKAHDRGGNSPLDTYGELQELFDWTPKEDERIIEAGQRAGQYLEEINKFDLRRLSRDEWLGFLRTFIARHAELESKYREIWEEMAQEAANVSRTP